MPTGFRAFLRLSPYIGIAAIFVSVFLVSAVFQLALLGGWHTLLGLALHLTEKGKTVAITGSGNGEALLASKLSAELGTQYRTIKTDRNPSGWFHH